METAEFHTLLAAGTFFCIELRQQRTDDFRLCIFRLQKEPSVGFFHITVDVSPLCGRCNQIYRNQCFTRTAASPHEKPLMRIFHETCESRGIMHDNDEIFAYLRAFEDKENYNYSLF